VLISGGWVLIIVNFGRQDGRLFEGSAYSRGGGGEANLKVLGLEKKRV